MASSIWCKARHAQAAKSYDILARGVVLVQIALLGHIVATLRGLRYSGICLGLGRALYDLCTPSVGKGCEGVAPASMWVCHLFVVC
jgi:hypothetical protein